MKNRNMGASGAGLCRTLLETLSLGERLSPVLKQNILPVRNVLPHLFIFSRLPNDADIIRSRRRFTESMALLKSRWLTSTYLSLCGPRRSTRGW